MLRRKIPVILLLVIFTFTMGGCDIFNADTVSNVKTGEGLSISQVQPLDQVYVDPGTVETDVIDILNKKRNKVEIVLSDDSKVMAEVAWEGSIGNYNSEELGTYQFGGTALYNGLSADASINVVVDDGYTLTLAIKGEGEIRDKENNIILSAPKNIKEIRCEPGTILQCTAVPHGNWLFMSWNGEHNIKESTVEITMDEHKELQATFGNILIFDHEIFFESWYNWGAKGKLENLLGYKIESIEIHVEIYLDNGSEVITTSGKITDIADREIVDWYIGGDKFADLRNATDYKIILRNIQLGE